MSVLCWGPLRCCVLGGGYFRLAPFWLINRALRQEEKAGHPAVVYLHPRDFAVDCPAVPMPIHRRFKSYVGRGTTESKLRLLLQEHRFSTCYEVLRQRGLLPKEAIAPHAAPGQTKPRRPGHAEEPSHVD